MTTDGEEKHTIKNSLNIEKEYKKIMHQLQTKETNRPYLLSLLNKFYWLQPQSVWYCQGNVHVLKRSKIELSRLMDAGA